jgi:integrase
VARLLTAAMDQNPELGLFLRLAVVLGARRSELVALKWREVDLAAGEVLIASGVVRVAGQPLIDKDTKSRDMTMNDGEERPRVLYVVVCVAPPASDAHELVKLAQAAGWQVCVIATARGRRHRGSAGDLQHRQQVPGRDRRQHGHGGAL